MLYCIQAKVAVRSITAQEYSDLFDSVLERMRNEYPTPSNSLHSHHSDKVKL